MFGPLCSPAVEEGKWGKAWQGMEVGGSGGSCDSVGQAALIEEARRPLSDAGVHAELLRQHHHRPASLQTNQEHPVSPPWS